MTFRLADAFKHNAGAFLILLGAVVSLPWTTAHAEEIKHPKAVVELFTSQGCSSCPPADEELARLVKRDDVLALSWHVDYWNYLGWPDTFSKAEFSDRQRRYAASFKRRGVYTPQAVINGRTHVVGSRGSLIDEVIDRFDATQQNLQIPLAVSKQDDVLRVEADVPADQKLTLWAIYYDDAKSVKIERGENRGRTITYHNVVRDVDMLGMAKSGRIDVSFPVSELERHAAKGCILLLQSMSSEGLPGPILGAVQVPVRSSS